MNQERQQAAIQLEKVKAVRSNLTFASMLPILYILLITDFLAFTWMPKFQTVYFIVAWSVVAACIIRIQQLIKDNSEGKCSYNASACMALLLGIAFMPSVWFCLLGFLFQILVRGGLIINNQSSWVMGFTLGATGLSLAAATPIIESWYGLLRGSFAFDGTRIKMHRTSLTAQILLFALFAGLLLLPIILVVNQPAFMLHKDDTTYLFSGFILTFVAMIWLVHQLENMRELQVSYHAHRHAPIDEAMLVGAGSLRHKLRAFGKAHQAGHLHSRKYQFSYQLASTPSLPTLAGSFARRR